MENIQFQSIRRRTVIALCLAVICPALLFLLTFACRSKEAEAVPSITTLELKQLVDDGVDFFLLDVRREDEFKAVRLAFADTRITHDSLEAHLELLPQDKDSSIIYCFCRGGVRSAVATRYLLSIGYKNVYNVAGGMLAWQKNGFETVGEGLPPKSDSVTAN